jgi:hypothetical protein
MPYVAREDGVYRADTGKKVGSSKNPKKYLRVLNAVEHGFVPTKGRHGKKERV